MATEGADEDSSTLNDQLSWIRGVGKQLQEDDQVEIVTSNKTRTLTVTDEARRVEREPYRCNGLLLTFDGYGTEYTLEIPESDKPARLLYPSGTAQGEMVKDIQRVDGDPIAVVAEQTATDLGIPER